MVPKRALTSLVTLDPAFMAANTIRDSFSAWVISEAPIKPGIDSIKGLLKSLRSDDPSRLGIMAAGGGSGHYNRLQDGEVRRAFLKMAREQQSDFLSSIIDSPFKLARLWKSIGRATENANRVAIYDAAIKQGASSQEAAFQALDIMDFGLRGDSKALAFFLDTVPFMNARIQGLYKLGRASGIGQGNGLQKLLPHKQVATHAAIIMGATIGLLAANWDDDRYWELPEWDRDLYYHLWIGGKHVRIPKPFEVGQIFSTVPERVAELMGKTGDSRLFMRRMLSIVGDTFAMNPIPQAVRPAADIATNRSALTGNPILGIGDQFKSPEQQYNAFTTLIAREIAEAMPDTAPEAMRSPKKVEYMIRGYFGSLGVYAMEASDALLRAAGNYPTKPESRPGDAWVVRRFLPEDDARATKYVGEFYDLNQDVQEIIRKARQLQERGDTVEANKVMTENRDLIGYASVLKSTERALASLRRQEQEIYDGRSGLSPAQKRIELERIKAQKNRLSKQAVTNRPRKPTPPLFNPFSIR